MSFIVNLQGVNYKVVQDQVMRNFFDIYLDESFQRISRDDSGNWHYSELRGGEKLAPLPLQSLGFKILEHLGNGMQDPF